tara:strand:+ start:3650 stop:7336 length:3687 start_codon:yes stop_codon:yes gene_type:complete
MAAPEPSGPFQKIENPTALNFDELYNAGFSDYDIAKALGTEYGKDLDGYLDMGGSVEDFLYVYSNAAEPGSISAFTDRLLRSLTVSAPTTAAVIGGAKLGKKIPFAQPLPTIATAAASGLLAAKGGESAVELGEDLGFFETNPPLRRDRFAAVFGDILGESLPLVFGSPYLMSNSQSTAGALVSANLDKIGGVKGKIVRAPGKAYSAAEDFLRAVGQTARGERGKLAKRGFFGVETTAAATSALGGATAREVLDTGEGGQFVGEVIGGMFEPRLIIARQIPRLINSFTGSFGTGARETQIGKKIYETLQKYGEDPKLVIDQLEENPELMNQFMNDLQVSADLPPLTPAQITGSPVLALLQNTVAKKSGTSVLDEEILARANKGYEFIESIALQLIAQGDPDSVRIATELRVGAISDLFQQAFIGANESAVGAATRLGRNQDFDVIGSTIRNNLDQIIKNANGQEELLWNQVPKDFEVPVLNLFRRVDEIKEKYFLETEDFPKEISAQIDLFKGRLGLTDTAPTIDKNVVKAQNRINNLTAPQRKDYNDILTTVKNPESRRLFTQGAEVAQEDSVDPDFVLSEPVRVLDAIRARRKTFGPSLSAGEKTRLAAAEKVANAELSLLKANRQAGLDVGLDDAEPSSIKVSDLTKLRSRALDAARQAMKDGDRGTAAAMGALANSILDELNRSPEGASAAYDVARAFSRGKNDALRRTFLGDVMARDADGAPRIEPTLLVSSLFEGGADATAIRFREIQDGADFVKNQLDELDVAESLRVPLDDVDFGPVDQQSLETSLAQAVQLTAAKVLDPTTGRIDPRRAATFLQDYNVLLRNFPQVRTMLEDGKQFEDMVKLLEKRRGRLDKAIKSNHVLAKILRYESPPVAIGEALGSTKPVQSLETVIKTVKRGISDKAFAAKMREEGFNAEDAMGGLKSAMIEWMWTKAGGSADKFNFAAAREAMFKPMTRARANVGTVPGGAVDASKLGRRASVADILKEQGVFTQAELDRLDFMLENGQKIQAAQAGGRLSEDMVDDLGFATDLLMRLAGARFGTDVANVSGLQSNTLITGGAGVRFVKNQFGDAPAGLQLNLLEKAVMDPTFLVKLLKKGDSAAEQQKAAKFLNAYLVSAGLSLGDDDDVSPGPDVKIETPLQEREGMGLEPYKLDSQPDLNQRIQQLISQAPPSGTPPALVGTTAPSTVSSLAQAPSSPNNAARMAAAFPNDGIMGLLATRA